MSESFVVRDCVGDIRLFHIPYSQALAETYGELLQSGIVPGLIVSRGSDMELYMPTPVTGQSYRHGWIWLD